MRAFRSSQYRKPDHLNPINELMDDRAMRIPIYAARARKEQPLFDQGVVLVKEVPEKTSQVRVKHIESLDDDYD